LRRIASATADRLLTQDGTAVPHETFVLVPAADPLILLERQQCELALRLPKFLTHSRIIVEQRTVFEDQVLADDALQRRRLLEELSAGASGLCGLLHRLLSLGLQALE